MSRRDLEVVTEGFRAATARPQPDFETMNRLFHPDHVFGSVLRGLGMGELVGAAGYREFLRESEATMMRWEVEMEGAVDLGEGRVLVVSTVRWRSSGSETTSETRAWTVATVQDGKIIRTEAHPDPIEALKAAGLREEVMSEENVDLVRNLYALGDFLSLNPDETDRAFRDYLDEQFEFHTPPDYPEGELVFRGREGVAQWSAMLQEAWDEWRFEPERFLDAGDRVVVFARLVGKGGASGVPFELETAHVWTIHAGRVASLHVYRDRSEALEAAGLRE